MVCPHRETIIKEIKAKAGLIEEPHPSAGKYLCLKKKGERNAFI